MLLRQLAPPRRAHMLMCLGVWLTLASSGGWATAAGQGRVPARDLQVRQPIEHEIVDAQIHEFHLTLAAGDFVRIVAEQHGASVSPFVYRPDGSLLFGRATEPDVFLPEVLVAIADVGGDYTLKLKGPRRGLPAGRYVVQLEDVHPATAHDQDVIAAYRAFERSVEGFGSGSTAAYTQAIDTLTSTRELFRAIGDRAGELRCLIRRAKVEFAVGRSSVGATAAEAEQLAIDLHDDVSRAAALRARGQAAVRAGDLAGALRLSEDALSRYRALGDEPGESELLQDIGIEYGRSGDSDRALARFEQALAIDKRWDSGDLPIDLNDMGIAYKEVGEYEKALEAYEAALGSPKLDPRSSLRAVVLNNAGNLQHLLGHDKEALAIHLEALQLSREKGDKETEARSLNTVGQTYAALGDDRQALQYEEDGLAIRRSMSDLSGQAASLTAIGDSESRLGDRDRAYARLNEGLAMLKAIDEEYAEPDVLRKLAAIDRDRGDLSLALDHVKAAVDLDEQLRARLTSPALRSTFVATAQDNYALYIDLLEQQAAADPNHADAAAALGVSERARARVLLESLLDARVDLRQAVDPALLDRERSLQKQLNAASAQISRALAVPGAKTPPPALVATYTELTGEYEKHLALIRDQSPRYAAMTHPQPLGAAEIQRDVLDDRTVLLEFELGADKSWLWAVTPTTVTVVPLPPKAQIDAAARGFYEALIARQARAGETVAARSARVAAADAQETATAASLGRLLLGPIATQLRGAWRDKRLAIVPAGSLEYVPFAALPLASDHEVARIPSASVLAALRTESAARPKATRTLAVLADPVFEVSDPRVAAAGPSRAPQPSAVPEPEDVDETLYVRAGLARLPFSRDEARAIAALAGPSQTFEATDFAASRATALGGALGNYRIVHFATHGIVDSARPSLSGLVFSLVNDRGEHQDGFVRLTDIYNLKLDADLVVLSACQTALGKDINGEGLIGLTRAFMYAGTPRVVASLWEVSDAATADLMRKFYSAMLQRHLAPAAALRAAQVEMAHDPRWAAPYYWAGFVFLGDWR